MRECNFGYLLHKRAQYQPDSTALVDHAAGEAVTYRELDCQSNRIARGLTSLGVGPGDRVGGLFRNSIAFFELFFATAKLGALIVPLNYRLETPELEFLIEDSDPTVFVYESVFDEKVSTLSETGCLDDRSLYSVDVPDGPEIATREPVRPFGALRMANESPVEIPAHDSDHPITILYTSGSTGRPKGVPLSHTNFFFSSVSYITDVGLTREDTTVTSSPIFHVGGLNIFTLPLLHVGGTVILQREFVPEETWGLMASHGVTKMFMIPTMLNSMLSVDGWEEYDLDSLELIISGGEPITTDMKMELQKIDVPLIAAYGLTETTDGTLFLRPEFVLDKGPNCNGKTFTHVEARVVDESGSEVPDGEKGELVHRGAVVATEYWNRPEQSESAWKDGWFHTGDIAKRDDDGFFHVYDRKDNMIVTGGENVYPSEVEEPLYSHDGVLEAVVFGKPSDRWGEQVTAVIVSESQELSSEDIRDFLRGRLANFKIPKEIIFTNELPKSGSGKIQRQAIVDTYTSSDA